MQSKNKMTEKEMEKLAADLREAAAAMLLAQEGVNRSMALLSLYMAKLLGAWQLFEEKNNLATFDTMARDDKEKNKLN